MSTSKGRDLNFYEDSNKEVYSKDEEREREEENHDVFSVYK